MLHICRHEYKRQQMNALYVIYKYFEIKAGNIPDTPVTVIFGAKAAKAYTIAKDIIHLILCLGELIANDPDVSPYLKVVMVENYNVTMAEKLIPACGSALFRLSAHLDISIALCYNIVDSSVDTQDAVDPRKILRRIGSSKTTMYQAAANFNTGGEISLMPCDANIVNYRRSTVGRRTAFRRQRDMLLLPREVFM